MGNTSGKRVVPLYLGVSEPLFPGETAKGEEKVEPNGLKRQSCCPGGRIGVCLGLGMRLQSLSLRTRPWDLAHCGAERLKVSCPAPFVVRRARIQR